MRTAAILTCIMSAGLLLWLGGVLPGGTVLIVCGIPVALELLHALCGRDE